MRIAAYTAMIAKICSDVFAQRGQSRNARGLIMKKVATFIAQGASAHPIPGEKRKQSHIRLTRPERPRRREMRLARRGSGRSFYRSRRPPGVARNRDRAAHEDPRARRRLQVAFADQPLVRVDRGVARELELAREIACRGKRIARSEVAASDAFPNLSRELVLQRWACGTVNPQR